MEKKEGTVESALPPDRHRVTREEEEFTHTIEMRAKPQAAEPRFPETHNLKIVILSPEEKKRVVGKKSKKKGKSRLASKLV